MKLHTEIFDNYEFALLPDASKYHLLGIWLLATQIDNKIPYDINWISRKIGASERVDIELLLAQGHLVYHDASNEIADSKQNALAETETETETETDITAGKLQHAFDAAFLAYPKRAGGNPIKRAQKAWTARIKAGVDPEVIHAGVVRYCAFVRATGDYGTKYVKQAATFFGPDEHYLEPWEILHNGKNRNTCKPGSAASRDKTHRELYREIAREGADEENMDIDYF
jgi:hypothetical protein